MPKGKMDHTIENQQSLSAHNLEPPAVQAEGLDYITPPCSRYGCSKDRITVPSMINESKRDLPREGLDEEIGESDSTTSPEFSPENKDQTTHPRGKKSNSKKSGSKRLASQSLPSRPPPSPLSGSDVSGSYSENEALTAEEIHHRIRRNKKALIRSKRNRYHGHHRPGKSRLTHCHCTECWADNLKAISRGAILPTVTNGYEPSRIAEKCEKAGSTTRIRLYGRTKTLTYNVWSGKVFDYYEGRLDTSGKKKRLGSLLTWGQLEQEKTEEEEPENSEVSEESEEESEEEGDETEEQLEKGMDKE